MENRLVCYTSF